MQLMPKVDYKPRELAELARQLELCQAWVELSKVVKQHCLDNLQATQPQAHRGQAFSEEAMRRVADEQFLRGLYAGVHLWGELAKVPVD
jgi:hypothetical protein